jgi:tRNA threonylcarbamoyladenosine biosynthesis protein TsaE
MKWICKNLTDLDEISREILANCSSRKVAFYGKMGAGKTTLIKLLCKHLLVIDVVKSPTFSIVNEYISESNQTVYHFDFYRLNSKQEAIDIGLDTYFNDSSYCFVEWPSVIGDLLPSDFNSIHIEVEEEKRIIKLSLND